MKRLLNLALLGVVSMFLIVACSNSKSDGGDSKQVETIPVQTSKGEVNVPKNPKKVAIFDYGTLDTLDALGVEVELAIPVKGIPKNLEKYAEKAIDAGTLHEPDFEKLNEFKPDLIIIGARAEKAYEELSKIAPTVYVGLDYNNYMTDLSKTASTLGQIFGKADEVSAKLTELSGQITELQNEAKDLNKTVLVLLTNDGKISAYGKGSRFGWVFSDLGLKSADESIEASTHGQEVNFEYISEKNPDVIVYVDRAKIAGGSKSGGDTLNNDLVNKTKAGQAGKVVPLDAEAWYIVAGGLNATKLQLEEIKGAIK